MAGGSVVLRASIGNKSFQSDTFVISPRLDIELGFNCSDSILLSWSSGLSFSSYQIYHFLNNRLEPLQETQDTRLVLSKRDYPSSHFAVAPLFDNGTVGIRSNSLNIDKQSTQCYINSFLATTDQKEVALTLSLSSVYNIKEIYFQRLDHSGWISIHQSEISLNPSYVDQEAKEGVNAYRTILRLHNGVQIASDIQEVLFLKNREIIVFPNPIKSGGHLTVLQKKFQSLDFKLYDRLGAEVINNPLESEFEIISISQLTSGIYYYSLEQDGNRFNSGKIIVL